MPISDNNQAVGVSMPAAFFFAPFSAQRTHHYEMKTLLTKVQK